MPVRNRHDNAVDISYCGIWQDQENRESRFLTAFGYAEIIHAVGDSKNWRD